MKLVSLPLTALAAGALLLAGCSSSGGGKTVDVSTVPLVAADLPSTWTAKAHDTSQDASDNATSKTVAACVGGKDTSSDRVKQAYSDDFSMGNSSITSQVDEFKSSSDVDTDVKLFTAPKAESCIKAEIQQQISKGMPTGTTVSNLSLKITPGSNGGPSNVVATSVATVGVAAQGQSLTVYDTSVSIRGNKIEATIDFTGVGQPIDAATMTKAIADLAKRAQG